MTSICYESGVRGRRSCSVEPTPAAYRAPRANSIAERFVLTVRRELLDHLLIFSGRLLEAVIKEFLVHYPRHARTKVWNSAALSCQLRSRCLRRPELSATTRSVCYSTSTPGPVG